MRVSHNQLAQWNHVETLPLYNSTDDLIDDYFECLIDCDSTTNSCRKICSDLLR